MVYYELNPKPQGNYDRYRIMNPQPTKNVEQYPGEVVYVPKDAAQYGDYLVLNGHNLTEKEIDIARLIQCEQIDMVASGRRIWRKVMEQWRIPSPDSDGYIYASKDEAALHGDAAIPVTMLVWKTQ